MNILMIARGYPTPKEPQWGCFEQDQAEALQRYGHKVIVVSVDGRFRWQFRRIGITTYEKDNVLYYNSFLLPSKIMSLFGGRKFAKKIMAYQLDKIYKLVVDRFGKPDIIYAHFFFNTLMGSFLKRKYSIPLVGIEHAGRFRFDHLDPNTLKDAKAAYEQTDAIITVSESLRKGLYYHFQKESFVIPNITANVFEKANITSLPQCDDLVFVSVGRLVKSKRFDLLIQSFGQINKSLKKWKLNIIGPGEEKENLQQLINNSGLQDKIHLLGPKTKSEIADIFSKSHIFILASQLETFGVVYIEAMSMGLPVIATICGGPEDFVNQSNGLLVPIDDVKALTNAIKFLYENYSNYDRIRISTECRHKFSSTTIVRQLTEVFEGVIERNNSNLKDCANIQ